MIMEPRPTQSGPCVNDISSLSQKILKEGNGYKLKLTWQMPNRVINKGIIGFILFCILRNINYF